MRVLVDRLWPRGVSKEELAVDFWLKDAAPSDALRRWYGHKPQRWESFAAKYRGELAKRSDLLRLLDELRRRGRVTLLYGEAETGRLLILSQVILSLQLPFAVVPLVQFTADKAKMGTMVAPPWLVACAAAIAAIIIALNVKLLWHQFVG